MQLFTQAYHPHDEQYARMRHDLIHKELLPMSEASLIEQLRYQRAQKAPTDENRALTQRVVGEIRGASWCPDYLKGILDSTAGSALIRQDLEAPAYA